VGWALRVLPGQGHHLPQGRIDGMSTPSLRRRSRRVEVPLHGAGSPGSGSPDRPTKSSVFTDHGPAGIVLASDSPGTYRPEAEKVCRVHTTSWGKTVQQMAGTLERKRSTPSRERLTICVFCGASAGMSESYVKAAYDLGKTIGERGHSTV
jgi:hypothetical protein